MPVILAGLESSLSFLDRFSKNTQVWNLINLRPMGAELFHATDGQTDMTRLIVAFRDFAKASRDVLITYSRLNWVSLKDRQPLMIQCLPTCNCLDSSYAYKSFVLKPAYMSQNGNLWWCGRLFQTAVIDNVSKLTPKTTNPHIPRILRIPSDIREVGLSPASRTACTNLTEQSKM
jgi:hypothetical protein